jgi:hypothetical protein
MLLHGPTYAGKTSEAEVALMNARQFLRRGKRRLQNRLSAKAMVALYDSVLYGMRYYVARHNHCASSVYDADLWDAVALYHALTRAGVFDDPLTFNRFSRVVERALWQGSFSFDARAILAEAESMLTQLGVIPTNEAVLPSQSFVNR